MAYGKEDLYAWFKMALLPAVEAVMAALGHHVTWNGTDGADFIICDEASDDVLVVIQVKDRFALPKHSRVLSCDGAEENATLGVKADGTIDLRHVEQLYGYLVGKGVRYGVLCSDVVFFPAKLGDPPPATSGAAADGRPHIYIGEPVQDDALAPSWITLLCYLVHRAIQDLPRKQTGPVSSGGPPAGSATPSSEQPTGPSRQEQQERRSGSIAATPVTLSADDVSLGVYLGYGASAAVYGGELDGLSLAIKVWERREDTDEAEIAEQEQQMLHEAAVLDALQRLQGMCVPTAVACGTLVSRVGDTFPFIAGERVESGVPINKAFRQLRRQTPAGACFSESALRKAVAAAAEGLAAIHSLGVAHGDVRCANLLVTPDGRAFWIDFGLAVLGASRAAMAADRAALADLLTYLQAYLQEDGQRVEKEECVQAESGTAGRGELELLELADEAYRRGTAAAERVADGGRAEGDGRRSCEAPGDGDCQPGA